MLCARDGSRPSLLLGVLTDGTVGHELVPHSARVFRYDRAFGISSRLVQAVSDHYPRVRRVSHHRARRRRAQEEIA